MRRFGSSKTSWQIAQYKCLLILSIFKNYLLAFPCGFSCISLTLIIVFIIKNNIWGSFLKIKDFLGKSLILKIEMVTKFNFLYY